MENIITKTNEQFGTIRQISGKPALWCGSDVAKALGYANSRKAITDHCRCVTKRYIPHPQSPSKQIEVSFIPEADVYRLICHSKLPKAQEFEKWVFEDVVPKAVHGEPKQMTFDDYKYFDKTFRGQPVLSVADISAMLNVDRSTLGYSVRRYLKQGQDFYFLEKTMLAEFKIENPKLYRHIGSMYVVTQSGFDKLCKIYGIKVDKPKLFIEEKTQNEKKTEHKKAEYCIMLGDNFIQEEIERCKNYLVAIAVEIDRCNKHNIAVNELAVRRKTLEDMVRELSSRICILVHHKLRTTTEYKF